MSEAPETDAQPKGWEHHERVMNGIQRLHQDTLDGIEDLRGELRIEPEDMRYAITEYFGGDFFDQVLAWYEEGEQS